MKGGVRISPTGFQLLARGSEEIPLKKSLRSSEQLTLLQKTCLGARFAKLVCGFATCVKRSTNDTPYSKYPLFLGCDVDPLLKKEVFAMETLEKVGIGSRGNG